MPCRPASTEEERLCADVQMDTKSIGPHKCVKVGGIVEGVGGLYEELYGSWYSVFEDLNHLKTSHIFMISVVLLENREDMSHRTIFKNK